MLTIRLKKKTVNYGKQHKFAVLKMKSYVLKNKAIFFDFIGHKKIVLVIALHSIRGAKRNFGPRGKNFVWACCKRGWGYAQALLRIRFGKG